MREQRDRNGTHRLGIDLGGTKIESIVLDEAGTEIHRERRSTPASREYDEIIAAIVRLIDSALKAVGIESVQASIGVATPGSLDPTTGRLRNSNTLSLNGMPLKDDLERELGRAIRLENDANCFALAEARQGAARGHGCVFGVIMGTGCGGGIVIHDRLLHGRNGISGEWGHISIDPQGRECYCGNSGCIETKISGTGVESAYQIRYGDSSTPKLSMQEIVARYRTGDPDCRQIFETFLNDFGRALGGILSILDPDVIVLGGGLSAINELYTLGVSRVYQYAFHEDPRTPIVPNQLGDSAGVYGAAWLGG